MSFELLQSDDLSLALADHLPTGVLTLDDQWRVQGWNRILEEWTGRLREEVQGRPLTDWYPNLSEPKIASRIRQAFDSDSPVVLSAALHGYFLPIPLTGDSLPTHMLQKVTLQKWGQSRQQILVVIENVTAHHLQLYALRKEKRSLEAERERTLLAEKALQEQKTRIEAALSGGELSTWEWDLETGCIFMDAKWLNVIGDRPESLGRHIRQWIQRTHPDDLPAALAAFQAHIAGETPLCSACYRILNVDGTWKWARIEGRLIQRNSRGEPKCMVGIILDVSEQKETEAKLQLAMSSSAYGVLVVNSKGEMTSVNDRFEKLFGYRREEIVGRRLETLIPEQYHARCLNSFVRFFANPMIQPMGSGCRFFARRKDGGEISIEISLTPLRTADGTQLLASVADVTEKVLDEQALRESEERYRLFVDHAIDAFFLHDQQGRILDVNRQACESLGYSRDELIGMTPLDFDPDVTPDRIDKLNALLESGGQPIFESRHRRKDGSVFPVEVRIRSFAFQGHRRSISLARDITDLKKAEFKVRASESQLRAIGDNIPGGVIYQYQRWPDRRHRFNYCSQGSDQIFGVPAAEVMENSDSIFSLIAAPHAKGLLAAALKSMTDLTIYDVELPFQARDGKHKWLRSLATPQREPDGSTLWNGVAVDISTQKEYEAGLRQSERRLRTALQAAGAVAFEWNVPANAFTRYYSIEPALPENLGQPESMDEVLARLHPDDQAEHKARLTKSLEEGTGYQNLYRVVRPDLSVRWLEEWGTVERGEDGAPKTLTGFAIDVTERKRSQDSLRDSEERYRLVGIATNDLIWDIDHAKGTVHWNDKYAELFGRPLETSNSWQWWIDHIHPDERERVAGTLHAAVEGRGMHWSQDYRFLKSDGHWAEIRDRAYIARDEAGTAVRVVGAMQDVTTLRRASNERDRLWNLSFDLLCVANFNGYMTQVNPAWMLMLGWSEEELLARPWLDFIHPEDQKASAQAGDQLIDGKTLREFENRFQCKSGDYRWLIWNSFPPTESKTILGIARDVTENKRREAALRESETLFRSFFEAPSAMRGIVELLDEDILHVLDNTTSASFFGLSQESMRNRRASELGVHSDAIRLWIGHYRDSLRTNRTVQFEYFHSTLNGRKSLFATVVPLAVLPGVNQRFAYVVLDVTERKITQEALRESEERFRNVLDFSPAAVYLRDLDGRYLFVNRRTAETFGIASQEWIGKRPCDILPAEAAELFERNDRSVRDSLLPQQIEETFVVDGRQAHFLAVQFPLFRSDGQAYAICGFSTEITELKQSEMELRLRDRAIQAVASGITIGDARQPDLPLIYVSPGFERLTGYSADEAIGRNCRFLQGEDTDPSAVDQLRKAIHNASRCTVKLRNYRKNGTPFWNEVSISPVLDEGGRLTHFVGVQMDVTDRVKLEEQFRQSQKMEAIGQLAGGIAHDFNNLLTVINGYSEMLLDEPSVVAPKRGYLAAIQGAGNRAAKLTSQLLAFSRRAIVEPKVLDLNRVIESSADMLRRLIGEDVRQVLNLSPSVGQVKIDPTQIDQLLMNLAVNARDAMPKGGTLSFETADLFLTEQTSTGSALDVPRRYTELTVSDDGGGMTTEVMEKVFEPFFTTKGTGKGTGLGLATVYGIVQQAGGSITVESEVGRGTRFRILLPAVHQSVEAHQSSHQSAVAPRGTETILLAEDDEQVRQFVKDTLQSLGYTVVTSGSSAGVLQAAAAHLGPIHLLLTDVVMPEIGGRELAEAVRAQKPEIRVLFMSGYMEDALARHNIESASEAFIQKPFTPYTLAQKLRNVLDAPPSLSNSANR